MTRSQFGRSGSKAIGSAGSEVLHKYVCAFDQACKDSLAGRLFQVESERLLGAIQPHEIAREARHRSVVATCKIAVIRPFDFDDARAQVGKLARGERRSYRLFDRDDR